MQQEVVTVGVDLAKNVFQVHAIDADGKVLVRRQLRRTEVSKFFAALPPCLVGMEACASAHHWGRELLASFFWRPAVIVLDAPLLRAIAAVIFQRVRGGLVGKEAAIIGRYAAAFGLDSHGA